MKRKRQKYKENTFMQKIEKFIRKKHRKKRKRHLHNSIDSHKVK
jgi:hypothetical protein